MKSTSRDDFQEKNKTNCIQKAKLNFAKEYKEKPGGCWQHILWSDETKINLFRSDGIQRVGCGPGQDVHSDCRVPTVKHGDPSLIYKATPRSIITGFLSEMQTLQHAVAATHR
ncbi:hypothetical protein JOB18_019585 [Solea senegalensis]|uniref:Transposase n=1 Tax=Solea senegalensis TaxID=28829 RepID=A0AAV6S3C4_SOLSE|nr:hypothetical protein JOB18_019585 [Solea senegalensis]